MAMARDDHELVDETQVAHHKRVGQVQGPPVDFAQHAPRLRRSHAFEALGEVVLPHQARNAVADGERIARLDQIQSQIDQRLEQERGNQAMEVNIKNLPFGVDAHLAGPFESLREVFVLVDQFGIDHQSNDGDDRSQSEDVHKAVDDDPYEKHPLGGVPFG